MNTLTARNKQGASDIISGGSVPSLIKRFFATWQDPENLSAVITGEDGWIYATKDFDAEEFEIIDVEDEDDFDPEFEGDDRPGEEGYNKTRRL